jgi:hypothetical protein
MFNELMVRLFGGASLALLLLAGLSTSARALADPPDGHYTCLVIYFCNTNNCPRLIPCGDNLCQNNANFNCGCSCAPYTGEEVWCGCTTAINP